MKKHLWIILLMFCSGIAYSQNQTYINQTKYWFYRNRLINEFCQVGEGLGKSLPVQVVKHGQYTFPGDGSIQKLGYYLGILATEIKLLKNSGQNYDEPVEELFYALLAVKRLDENAEDYYYCWEDASVNTGKHQFVYPVPTLPGCNGANVNIPQPWNGFLNRTDFDPREGSDNRLFFNKMTGVTQVRSGLERIIQTANNGDPENIFGEPEKDFNNKVANDMSHDQINHLLMGFRLVQAMLDGTEHYTHNNTTYNVKNFAQQIVTKILDYMHDGSEMSEANCQYLKSYSFPQTDNIHTNYYLQPHWDMLNFTICSETSSPFMYNEPGRINWLFENPVTQQPGSLHASEGASYPYIVSYGYAKVGTILNGKPYTYPELSEKAWKSMMNGAPNEIYKANDALKVLTLVALTDTWNYPAEKIPCTVDICFNSLFGGTCKKTIKLPVPGSDCGELYQDGKHIFCEQSAKAHYQILPLLYNVLFNSQGFGLMTPYYEDFFTGIIDKAPCRGPFWYSNDNIYDKALFGWASWGRFVTPDQGNNLQWYSGPNENQPLDPGEYNGMDYMLLYNLWNIYKGNYSYQKNWGNNMAITTNLTISGNAHYNARGYRELDGSYKNGEMVVNASVQVINEGSLYLRAGSSIDILPGFEVYPGATFYGEIHQPQHNWEWEMTNCGIMDVSGDGIPDGHRITVQQETTAEIPEPGSAALGNCYPNPGSDIITIPYSIGEKASVEIFVSDLMGRRMKTVVRKEQHEKGRFNAQFDASELHPGVYLYTLKCSGLETAESKRMMIVK